MRLSKTLVLIFVILSTSLFSQVVNVENKRNYDDTAGYSGAIDASFSAFKINDLIVNASFRPRVQYKSKKHYFLTLGDLMYSKGASNIFSNLGMFHLRYAYRVKVKLKWESYYQVQYNQLLDQRSRMLLGSGLRLKCLDKKGYKIFAGVSTFIEQEVAISDVLIHYEARMSNYISWYFDPKSNFFFSGVVYVQPLLSNFSDVRVSGQYALYFNFTKRIDFKFEFAHMYDTDPFLGVVPSTFNTSFGVHFKIGGGN